MNNLIGRYLTPEEIAYYQEKPYDICHLCKRLSHTCEGPNLLAMDGERLTEWLAERAKALKMTHAEIAEKSQVAIGTVHNVMRGKTKDIRVGTLRDIVKVLIGGCWGHPCHHAQQFLAGVSDDDRIELLERQLESTNKELETARAELTQERKINEEIHTSYHKELDEVRKSYRLELENVRGDGQKRIDHLVGEVAYLREVNSDLRNMLNKAISK